MPLSISNDAKNSLSVTPEDKASGSNITWDEADFTWDEGNFPWTNIGLPITKPSKNSLTILSEDKN